MASCFTPTGTDIDWLWGSLKPWQILHSTLAERERNGSALDVWELVHETLGAATYAANSIAREEELQEFAADDRKRSAIRSNSWAHGIRFLGDDGEFWKPGGVMESRVREWLSRRQDDDDEEDHEQQLAAAHAVPSSLSPPPHHPHHHLPQEYCTSSSSQLALAACSTSAAAPNLLQHNYDSPLQNNLAADRHGYYIGVNVDYQCSEDSEAEEEENPVVGIGDIEEDQASPLAAAAEDENVGYRDDYGLIRSNFDDDHQHVDGISSVGECRLVVNRYCSGVDRDNDHDHFGGAARLAAGRQLHLDEEIVEEVEVCAVCLEKLNGDEEEEEERDAAVQALACRHLFHKACIAPWLQRQPHACCPCCRAPILAPPQLLHLAAPLHLAAASLGTNCSGYQHNHGTAPPHDIMGLLADMEAALERLGFRS
ncbi:hypothetical protein GOP47_0017564 [Adiantum capillus-veneris]|uniref:RING-type E3 ubiquitin transferase n=1 Tax=Adiantum capillus-veneris TaxID=13818 RepID=A0A9D4UGT4_ADICA|nr:hypothetical protein GOP47_0017564 [Adiantum capillus-veneris]